MYKAANAYMQTQVTTTTPGHIIVLLYNGAVTFLEQAKQEIDARNYAQKGILISQALDIIAELDSSLNMEKGGEISRNLHQLYMFCSNRLLLGNLKMNKTYLNEVIDILTELRSAFEEISRNQSRPPQVPQTRQYAR